MKKTISLFLLALTSIFFLHGQSIPNNGFETWVPAGPAESPQGWITSPGGTKSTDAHTGAFAIKLQAGIFTDPMRGTTDTLPGAANTGTLGAGPGVPGIAGIASTARPDSLTGWVKYTPSGSDSFLIIVVISKWDRTNSMRQVISMSKYAGSAASSYVRFSFPLLYLDNETPDTLNIECSSSTSPRQDPLLGSELWLDDLAFVINNSTGIDRNMQAGSALFSCFPNPAQDKLYLYMADNGIAVDKIQILDASGRIMRQQGVSALENGIEISALAAGVYLLQLTDGSTHHIYSQRFVKE